MMLNPGAWKAYNCYSASLGSLLAAAGLPYPGIVLNSGWDFFFDPSNIGNICMAGVYPGTEHPQISANLHQMYHQQVIHCHDKDWPACLHRLSNHLAKGQMPLLCVLNKACRHIPRSTSAAPLSHYLIAVKIEAGCLFFFDSLLNRQGAMPLETLSQAMQFDTAEGERVAFRTAHLPFDRPGGPTYRSAKQTAGNIFFPPPHPIPVGPNTKKNVTYGIQAMRDLFHLLREMERPSLSATLKPLCESLRYVQYQRKYFTESLQDIIDLFPRHVHLCRTLMHRAEVIADDWFRLKIALLYNLRKDASQLLAGIVPRLDELSIKEEQAMKALQHLRQLLQTPVP